MKTKFSKISFAVAAVLFSTQSLAEPLPDWVGSYSANGQCYCTPSIPASLRNKIMATPVGGQSIQQVCARVGAGPGLKLENGEFNYPAYHDSQCGNGPFAADPQGCEGRTKTDKSVCTGSGPEWDLKSAYARPAPAEQVSEAEKLAQKERREQQREAATLARKRADKAKQQAAKEAQQERERLATLRREEAAQRMAAKLQAQQQAELQAQQQAELQAQQQAELQAQQQAELQAQQQAELQAQQQAELQAQQQAELQAQQQAELQAQQQAELQAQQQAELSAHERLQQREQELIAKEKALQEALAQIARERAEQEALAQKIRQEAETADAVDVVEAEAEPQIEHSTGTAVRVPAQAALQNDLKGYIEVAPVSYDFGGAGAALGGAVLMGSGWQLTARAAAAQEYTELMAGVRKSYLPGFLKGAQLNLVGGVEYGNFDLGITDLTDSGVMIGSSLSYNPVNRMLVSAGLSYSSFFEGDPGAFAQVLYRVIDKLDLSTRVEGGDNTNLSLGLRYHY